VGGAWNASMVSEYVQFKGKIITRSGLGETISQATAWQFSFAFSGYFCDVAVGCSD
jgi:ABC-type anion transport system duplicated permease subunit